MSSSHADSIDRVPSVEVPACGDGQPTNMHQSVIDLPAAWLSQLAATLDPAARLSLFKTCRAMRNLMLSERKLRLHFQYPQALQPAVAARNSLLLASRHSRDIHLTLIACRMVVTWRTPLDTAPRGLMLSTMEAAGQGLGAVQSVRLQGLVLDALVPVWLLSTCPNLSSLEVTACQFRDLPDPSVPVFGAGQQQIRHLTWHDAPDLTEQDTFLRWQHQWRALAGLQSLNLLPPLGKDARERLLECCSVANAQLTQLDLQSVALVVPASLTKWFPALSVLCVSDRLLRDDDFKVLLGMPGLRCIDCEGFLLEHSFVDHPCPWTELRFQYLHTGTFALMPLKGRPELVSQTRSFLIHEARDLEATRRAVDAVIECGGLQWRGTQEVVINAWLGAGKEGAAEVRRLLSNYRARISVRGPRFS